MQGHDRLRWSCMSDYEGIISGTMKQDGVIEGDQPKDLFTVYLSLNFIRLYDAQLKKSQKTVFLRKYWQFMSSCGRRVPLWRLTLFPSERNTVRLPLGTGSFKKVAFLDTYDVVDEIEFYKAREGMSMQVTFHEPPSAGSVTFVIYVAEKLFAKRKERREEERRRKRKKEEEAVCCLLPSQFRQKALAVKVFFETKRPRQSNLTRQSRKISVF